MVGPGSRWGRWAARALLAVEQCAGRQLLLRPPCHHHPLPLPPPQARTAAPPQQNRRPPSVPPGTRAPARRASDHLLAVETRGLREAMVVDLDAAAPALAGEPQQHLPVSLHFRGSLSDFSMAAELFTSWFSRKKTLSRKLPPQPALFRLSARFPEGSAGRPYNSPTEREEER